jgi:hypothetical protein
MSDLFIFIAGINDFLSSYVYEDHLKAGRACSKELEINDKLFELINVKFISDDIYILIIKESICGEAAQSFNSNFWVLDTFKTLHKQITQNIIPHLKESQNVIFYVVHWGRLGNDKAEEHCQIIANNNQKNKAINNCIFTYFSDHHDKETSEDINGYLNKLKKIIHVRIGKSDIRKNTDEIVKLLLPIAIDLKGIIDSDDSIKAKYIEEFIKQQLSGSKLAVLKKRMETLGDIKESKEYIDLLANLKEFERQNKDHFIFDLKKGYIRNICLKKKDDSGFIESVELALKNSQKIIQLVCESKPSK